MTLKARRNKLKAAGLTFAFAGMTALAVFAGRRAFVPYKIVLAYDGDVPYQFGEIDTSKVRATVLSRSGIKLDDRTELSVDTSGKTARIHASYEGVDQVLELPDIAVDRLQASYKDEIGDGQAIRKDDIEVKAIYEDGTVREAKKLEVPEGASAGTDTVISTEYGQALLDTNPYVSAEAVYNDQTTADSVLDADKISVIVHYKDGSQEEKKGFALARGTKAGDAPAIETEYGRLPVKLNMYDHLTAVYDGVLTENAAPDPEKVSVSFFREDGSETAMDRDHILGVNEAPVDSKTRSVMVVTDYGLVECPVKITPDPGKNYKYPTILVGDSGVKKLAESYGLTGQDRDGALVYRVGKTAFVSKAGLTADQVPDLEEIIDQVAAEITGKEDPKKEDFNLAVFSGTDPAKEEGADSNTAEGADSEAEEGLDSDAASGQKAVSELEADAGSEGGKTDADTVAEENDQKDTPAGAASEGGAAEADADEEEISMEDAVKSLEEAYPEARVNQDDLPKLMKEAGIIKDADSQPTEEQEQKALKKILKDADLARKKDENGIPIVPVYFQGGGVMVNGVWMHQDWANQPYWNGTIATQGCGICALAVPLTWYGYAAEGDAYNPIDIARSTGHNSPETGLGDFGSVYGLHIQGLQTGEVKQALRDGKFVYINGGGTDWTGSPHGGHFMMLIGIKEDGTIAVADSGTGWNKTSYWANGKQTFDFDSQINPWVQAGGMPQGLKYVAIWKD